MQCSSCLYHGAAMQLEIWVIMANDVTRGDCSNCINWHHVRSWLGLMVWCDLSINLTQFGISIIRYPLQLKHDLKIMLIRQQNTVLFPQFRAQILFTPAYVKTFQHSILTNNFWHSVFLVNFVFGSKLCSMCIPWIKLKLINSDLRSLYNRIYLVCT